MAGEILLLVDDPPSAGQTHWTATKLCGWLRTEKDLDLSYRTLYKAKRLRYHIEPVYLPPYGPDFNPIERLWQHLKGHHLAGYITKSGAELNDKLYRAIRSLLEDPETIRSVCRTHSE